MGAVSPFGAGVSALLSGLASGASAVTTVPELASVHGLRCRVQAAVPDIDEKVIPRKFRRSMSPMSVYATMACREALDGANLGDAATASGRMAVVIGSTLGSPATSEAIFREYLFEHSLERMKSTLFFQVMGHSAAANVAQALGVTGRVMAPSAACATGCQTVGLAYETIAYGRQDWALAGGADELHPMTVSTFDIINAASTRYNETPTLTPRPFDTDRDGVVCAEGGGILLLEALETAQARHATILAEVCGFSTVSDPSNMANPNADSMEFCMRAALSDASIDPSAVSYVNAHATGTEQGDAAECEAIARVFGDRVPVSSMKGHMGHTMAASGALELIASVAMMRRGELFATRNLEHIDPACAAIRHALPRERHPVRVIVKNSFAMGGVNSCLVLKEFEP
jgi:3-oxoacyl-[acyl-carrier-protein] synthase II